MKKKKDSSSATKFISIGSLVFIGLLFLFPRLEDGSLDNVSSEKKVLSSVDDSEFVDEHNLDEHNLTVTKYLKEMSGRQRDKSTQMLIENYYTAPKIENNKYEELLSDQGLGSENDQLLYGLDLESGSKELKGFNHLDTDSLATYESNIENDINNDLLETEIDNESVELEQKVFVEDFQKNLKASGYKAIIGKDLKVKGIRRVQKN